MGRKRLEAQRLSARRAGFQMNKRLHMAMKPPLDSSGLEVLRKLLAEIRASDPPIIVAPAMLNAADEVPCTSSND